MRRTWIKLFCDQTLHGTTFRELGPDERFVWLGFLLLAGDSPIDGKICIDHGVGFTDDQLAAMLKIPADLLTRAKLKCVEFEKIRIIEGGVIEIVNWGHYQSEYSRQKKYRQRESPPRSPSFLKNQKREERGERKLSPQVTLKSYNQKLQRKVTTQIRNSKSFRSRLNVKSMPSGKKKKNFKKR